jgi:2-dehydro-3-deoxygluconokinase
MSGRGAPKNKLIVTLGEIMLRLKPPGFERFMQSPMLEATFGGSEANVAASLALFGLEAAFVTALPDNAIGDACVQHLRKFGVDTSCILRSEERIGTYYLEFGAGQRPSRAIYDRENSAMATIAPDAFVWDGIFAGAGWFHISGITPAISESAAQIALDAVRAAKERGLMVSCDYNYRSKLWNYGKTPPEVMRTLMPYVDVGIAGAEDCQIMLGVRPSEDQREAGDRIGYYETLSKLVFTEFPNLKMQAITLREGFSANHHGWSACMYDGSTFTVSRRYDITEMVDRVGAGDSFSAGLVYGLYTGMTHEEALNFAVAASCLKHSIAGDVNLATVREVRELIAGDTSGRVQR